MKEKKVEANRTDEILTPVLSSSNGNDNQENIEDLKEDSNIEKVILNNFIQNDTSFQSQGFSNSILERNNNMINATNNVVQSVLPGQNVLFNTNNVVTNSCNSCCGWLSHNLGSGLFTITKPGIYKVHFNANVANTVAVSGIELDITNAGENILGGSMQVTPTAVGDYENLSAEVLIRVPCNSSVLITVENNTPTNPVNVSQPSLVITREC